MKGKNGAWVCWSDRLSSRGLVLVSVPAEIIDFETRLAPLWLLWEVIVLVEEVVVVVMEEVEEVVVVVEVVVGIWSCLVVVTFTESPSRSVFVARLGPAQLSRDKS